MTDPSTTTPVHLDPTTIKFVWGAIIAFVTTMATALGVIATVAVKARTWLLRSERATKTDDLVHGVGETVEPPKGDALGLYKKVQQLEDIIIKYQGRVRNIEIEAGLPDMSDPEALTRLALGRLDTGQYKAVVLAEDRRRSEQPAPAPPPKKPFGRWRGRPE